MGSGNRGVPEKVCCKVSALPWAQKPDLGEVGCQPLEEQSRVDGELFILGVFWSFGKWSDVCAGVWDWFLFPKGLLPPRELYEQTVGRQLFSHTQGHRDGGSAPPYLKYERMQTAMMREAREME